jgi:hypothetical protein
MLTRKTVAAKGMILSALALVVIGVGLAACGGGGGGSTAGVVGGGGGGGGGAPPVLPPTCSTTPAGGPITPNIIVSRLSGVAPLAVFFDATGTVATAAPVRPFHDLEYRWNFGDAGSGSWGDKTTGSNGTGVNVSRNSATGPVAAHVYETPGTYTVTAVITDGTNTATENCVQITVQDPEVVFVGNKTVCVANVLPVAGAGGCPAGATVVASANAAAAVAANIGTGNVRILFNRGDTFSAATSVVVNRAGPGIIGAYGVGAAPKIQGTTNATTYGVIAVSGGFNDWRLMDLELDGSLLTPGTSRLEGISGQGKMDQLTMLRLNIHDTYTGILFAESRLGSSLPWDQLALVDSTIFHGVGGAGGNGAYLDSSRLMWLGNLLDDTLNTEHGLRVASAVGAVISNSLFSRAAATKTVLTVRAADFNGSLAIPAGTFTEKLVIADNKFVPSTVQIGSVGQGPLGAAYDGRIRNLIWERNWWAPAPGGIMQVQFSMVGSEMTIRNNIAEVSGAGTDNRVFDVAMTSTVPGYPVPDQIRFYNNSAFSVDTGTNFRFLNVTSTTGLPTNVSMVNNLAYAPTNGGGLMSSSITVSQITNTTDSPAGGQLRNTSPLLTTQPPLVPAHWKPLAGSYAIGSGTSIPVWSDFFRTTQPATRDLGAVIH